MTDFAPELPAPLDVEIYNFSVLGDNTFRLWLRFEDESYLSLDFPTDSEASRRTVALLTELATEMLSRIGNRGLVISGFTEPTEEPEGSS